jgi:hypothetical protein
MTSDDLFDEYILLSLSSCHCLLDDFLLDFSRHEKTHVTLLELISPSYGPLVAHSKYHCMLYTIFRSTVMPEYCGLSTKSHLWSLGLPIELVQ